MGEFVPQHKLQHVVVCPSAGIGHLLPFLRAASMLSSSSSSFKITLMTIKPVISTSETTQITAFLATHPHIHTLDVQLPCTNTPPASINARTTSAAGNPDPFFVRYAAISDSAHLLARHLISLIPTPTAILSDIMFVSGFHQALQHLAIPVYVLPITSCRFFALAAYLAHHPPGSSSLNKDEEEVVIGNCVASIPKSSIPPPFFNPDHIFTKLLFSNSSWLHKCKGIVFNSFDLLERGTLSALGGGNALSFLPPIYSIGPLKPLHFGGEVSRYGYLAWLDKQPPESVVYVNFGSRTAMAKEQIRELGEGLETSGVRFLWVVKTNEVDNEEKEELSELLGEGFLERINESKKGLVLKEWVDQDRVLVHPSIGGFLSHCGWNSITEAAQRGLPVLAWPLHGDQKLNAEVAEKAGLGVWARGWGWIGERLVKREEIGEKIKEVMMNKELRIRAIKVGEEATKAWESENGSSKLMMSKLIQDMNN